MMTPRQFLVGVSVSLVGGLLAGSLNIGAWADTTLTSADEPIHVELKTQLDVEKAQHGDAFEAVLQENYHFNNKVLPSGTVLRGRVQAARKSYSFAMPGYAELDIHKAVFPSGEEYSFQEKKQPTTDKITHPEATTWKGILKAGLPFSAVSAMDSVPLKYAAGWSGWAILPVSLAARMTLGAALEHTKTEKAKHDKKSHGATTRYGHGMLRGTGLPGMYHLLKPSPEPELTEGAIVPLHFNKKDMISLFEAGNSSKISNEEQPTVETEVQGNILLPKAEGQPDSKADPAGKTSEEAIPAQTSAVEAAPAEAATE